VFLQVGRDTKIATPLAVVFFHLKLGTHRLYANTQKAAKWIFEILKFLADFLNLKFGLSLWNSSSRAVGANRALV